MTDPAVALAVVTSPLGVLLIKRRDRTPPWSFPGGTIEPEETAEQAAERETLEETGLHVAALRVIGRRLHPSTGRELVYVAARPVDRTDVGATDPAVTAVRWIANADVHELLFELYAPVADHLAG